MSKESHTCSVFKDNNKIVSICNECKFIKVVDTDLKEQNILIEGDDVLHISNLHEIITDDKKS